MDPQHPQPHPLSSADEREAALTAEPAPKLFCLGAILFSILY